MEEKVFVVTIDNQKLRLDVYLEKMLPVFSRSHIKNQIEKNEVFVNNKNVKAGYNLKVNDEVKILINPPKTLDLTPEDIKIDIVYEDDDLAVINKPQGMVVHPAVGNYNKTLVNALLYNIKNLSGINGVIRPGIVHRLDKDTSGLLVVAKNDAAHVNLSKQIQNKTCKRFYLALLEGVLKDDSGVITNYISRDLKNRLKMAVNKDNKGKIAQTLWNVVERFANYTLCEFELKTGYPSNKSACKLHLTPCCR
jgi:23S rRNA pseudouridine1911/1915/1917 synthase